MTNTKYELTDETHSLNPRLRRIRALVDIHEAGVKAGDLGGWVETEANLSVYDSAWIYGNARVSGDAWIYGNARVYDSAWVSGNAWIYDSARVYGDARVSGDARVYGDARAQDRESILTAGPLSSEGDHGTLVRGTNAHIIVIGCWSGTTDELRDLASSDKWPSRAGAEVRAKYAPRLIAFAALCDAQIALWNDSPIIDRDAKEFE